ncbi:arsenate reductase family protein [Arenicella sp.]|nr:arsenate reductase family protein [Arenicella sp.]
MKLYQYPKCSTCRKAIKLLNEQGIEFKSIDITEKPPAKTELKAMLASYDGDIRKLFNTSGVQYRELKMKDKLPTMTAKQAIDLLAENGKLIKRPFLLNSDKQGIVGFKENDWLSFLKTSSKG